MQATASRTSMAPSAVATARPTRGAARVAFKPAPAAIAKASFARSTLVQKAARVQGRSYVVVRAANDKASRGARRHGIALASAQGRCWSHTPAT